MPNQERETIKPGSEDVWERGMAHLREKKGDLSLADRLAQKAAEETVTVMALGEEIECRKISVQRGLELEERVKQIQAEQEELQDLAEEDMERARYKARRLAEEIGEVFEDVTVDPSLTQGFVTTREWGLEVGIEVLNELQDRVRSEAEEAKKFR